MAGLRNLGKLMLLLHRIGEITGPVHSGDMNNHLLRECNAETHEGRSFIAWSLFLHSSSANTVRATVPILSLKK